MNIEISLADYHNVEDGADLLALLDAYARDPMGGGQPLPQDVQARLLPELASRPWAFTVLARVGADAVGLINCLEGFSSFAARPLVNIHDVVVLPAWRGRGISRLMLEKVEEVALDRGCCKLTLEVLEGNRSARQAYQKFGFSAYTLDERQGAAMFWQKSLTARTE